MSAGDIKYEHSLWLTTGTHNDDTLSDGDLLQLNGSNEWEASGSTPSGTVGVAVEDAETGEKLRVLRSGVVEIGSSYDLSSVTNGYEIPEYPGEVEGSNVVIYLM